MDERRTSRRIPVTFRASFSPITVGTGEGTIVDLAPGGCRVETTRLVPVTTYLELRLEVSLREPPIVVNLAAVRWARGNHLGIEFLSIETQHQARLQRIVERAQPGDE
jgi:hypothetical protein